LGFRCEPFDNNHLGGGQTVRPNVSTRLGFVFLVILLAAAAAPTSGPAGSPAPEQGLLDRDAEFDRVTAERGLDGFLSFLAADTAFFPAGGHIATGPDAARAIWGPILTAPETSLRWKPLKAEIARSGDLGYTYGTYVFRGPAPGGEIATHYGKYVTIWRKESGAWKVAVDLGTPSPAPASDSSNQRRRK
jgi:ketosteroid isomerase-like protein